MIENEKNIYLLVSIGKIYFLDFFPIIWGNTFLNYPNFVSAGSH